VRLVVFSGNSNDSCKGTAGRGTFVTYQPEENTSTHLVGYVTRSFDNEIHRVELNSAETELRSAGYRVFYLGPSGAETMVRRAGFEFEPLHCLDAISIPFGIRWRPPRTQDDIRRWLSSLFVNYTYAHRETGNLVKSLPRYAAEVDNVVKTVQPSLLLFDPFVLVFYSLFHKHGVPAAALSTKPLLEPDPDVPPYTAYYMPTYSWASDVRVRLSWLACRARYTLWAHYDRALSGYDLRSLAREISRGTGFRIDREWATRPVLFDMRFRSLPELVLHAREFDFTRRQPLPANVYFLGPNVYEQRHENSLPWDELNLRQKVIFCSVGTVLHADSLARRERFFRELLVVLADRPQYTLIVALGPGISPKKFSGVPDNVHLYPRVPQLDVLGRADLFITHGGSNSVKESISRGVPMLVYPDRGDQPGVSARVVQRGLGERAPMSQARAPDIAKLIDRLLYHPKYRSAALVAQQIAARYDKHDVALKTVRGLLRRQASSPRRADVKAETTQAPVVVES